eukprot:Gb_31045 [translate_table: standard]
MKPFAPRCQAAVLYLNLGRQMQCIEDYQQPSDGCFLSSYEPFRYSFHGHCHPHSATYYRGLISLLLLLSSEF